MNENVVIRVSSPRLVLTPTSRGTDPNLGLKASPMSVTVVQAGPVGPAGPSGAASSSMEYTQVASASSWVINHNLGFKPNVTVEEAVTGAQLMGLEIHHSVNQVELQFNTPRAGTARLS